MVETSARDSKLGKHVSSAKFTSFVAGLLRAFQPKQ